MALGAGRGLRARHGWGGGMAAVLTGQGGWGVGRQA